MLIAAHLPGFCTFTALQPDQCRQHALYENVFVLTLKGLRPCGSEGGNYASDLPIVSVNSHAISVTPGGGRRVADASSIGRSQSAELVCTRHISAVYFSCFIRFMLLYVTVCLPYKLLNDFCFRRL